MKVWRRRRRVRADEAPPLTPGQVKALRARGDRMQSAAIMVYIGFSVLGAIAMGVFLALNDAEHVGLISWSALMAVVFTVALFSARAGFELAASVAVYVLSVATIVGFVAHLSSALSLESFLLGLAIVPFILVRKEIPALRMALAAAAVAAYLTCEFAWPDSTVFHPFEGDVAYWLAQANRVGAATLLILGAIVVELRHASMVRVLAGAARYGELRATTDELTGVYNRRPVIAQLSEWARTGRGNYAIALIDLDHFKDINDTHGHDCGDVVIQTVATTLRAHFRESDMVSRWGGDEFLVLMPGIRQSDVLPVLERLRRAISLIEKRCSGHVHTVTVSIGAAMGALGQTPDECIAAADHALYRAKENGRNRVVAVGVSEPHQTLGRPEPDAEPSDESVTA